MLRNQGKAKRNGGVTAVAMKKVRNLPPHSNAKAVEILAKIAIVHIEVPS